MKQPENKLQYNISKRFCSCGHICKTTHKRTECWAVSSVAQKISIEVNT